VQEFGCEECGTIGWRRGGEEIVQTGDEDGVPQVMRVVREDGGSVGGSWMAECGHKLREGSLLERFFGALPAGEVTSLPRNG
jgi:hypothetical protein